MTLTRLVSFFFSLSFAESESTALMCRKHNITLGEYSLLTCPKCMYIIMYIIHMILQRTTVQFNNYSREVLLSPVSVSLRSSVLSPHSTICVNTHTHTHTRDGSTYIVYRGSNIPRCQLNMTDNCQRMYTDILWTPTPVFAFLEQVLHSTTLTRTAFQSADRHAHSFARHLQPSTIAPWTNEARYFQGILLIFNPRKFSVQ